MQEIRLGEGEGELNCNCETYCFKSVRFNTVKTSLRELCGWVQQYANQNGSNHIGTIQKPRGQIFGTLSPLLLNKAYVLKWPFSFHLLPYMKVCFLNLVGNKIPIKISRMFNFARVPSSYLVTQGSFNILGSAQVTMAKKYRAQSHSTFL